MGGVAAPELPMTGGITRCYGHVGMCECTSYPSSRLRASTWGYPIYKVLIVAPEPTSGEVANQQVGPTLRCPTQLS
jgi:hypothetical protein